MSSTLALHTPSERVRHGRLGCNPRKRRLLGRAPPPPAAALFSRPDSGAAATAATREHGPLRDSRGVSEGGRATPNAWRLATVEALARVRLRVGAVDGEHAAVGVSVGGDWVRVVGVAFGGGVGALSLVEDAVLAKDKLWRNSRKTRTKVGDWERTDACYRNGLD